MHDLFVSWPVDTETDETTANRLLAGVDVLIRRGLLEQCPGWPRDWSTDGILPFRCIRTGSRSVEVTGLCWMFTARRDSWARFPVRAFLEIDPDHPGLRYFRCDIGEYDAVESRVPQLPKGAMLLPSDGDATTPQLLVGRRLRPILWTRVISYGQPDQP